MLTDRIVWNCYCLFDESRVLNGLTATGEADVKTRTLLFSEVTVGK